MLVNRKITHYFVTLGAHSAAYRGICADTSASTDWRFAFFHTFLIHFLDQNVYIVGHTL
jgi:hypothetical protein